MCVGTSLGGRAPKHRRLDRFEFSDFPSPLACDHGFLRRFVWHAAAWADFVAAAGLDVVGHATSTTSPTATAPGVEEEVAGQPTSCQSADDMAGLPALGTQTTVNEPAVAEDDIEPRVRLADLY